MRRLLLIAAILSCGCAAGTHNRVLEEGPPSADSFRVAAIHLSADTGDYDRKTSEGADAVLEHNFQRTAELVRKAKLCGANVIVTPEYINTGVAIPRSARIHLSTPVPEAPTGKPLFDELFKDAGLHENLVHYSRLAHEVAAYLVTTVVERDVDDEGDISYFNTAVAFDPEGRLVGKYRKINLYIWEYLNLTRGTDVGYFDTPYGRFGLLLCFDALWPTTWGALKSEDVDFFILQSFWEHAPITGQMAMNMLSDMSGLPVVWSNQQRGGLGGGAGVIRPWATDSAFGTLDPAGVMVANLDLPERLRKDAEDKPVVAYRK